MLMVTGEREEEIVVLDYPKQSLKTGFTLTHPPKMTQNLKVLKSIHLPIIAHTLTSKL